jgi:hypothetical protein
MSEMLFTYQFNKQSRWDFGESMSSENHFMMVGVPLKAFPIERLVEVIDPSFATIATAEVLPNRN